MTPCRELGVAGRRAGGAPVLGVGAGSRQRRPPVLRPLSLCPSFSPRGARPSAGRSAGPKRSPWKRSRPCSLARSGDCLICLSVSKLRQDKFLFPCVLPGVLSEPQAHQGPGPRSQRRAALHGAGTDAGRADTTCRPSSLGSRRGGEGGSLRRLAARCPTSPNRRRANANQRSNNTTDLIKTGA